MTQRLAQTGNAPPADSRRALRTVAVVLQSRGSRGASVADAVTGFDIAEQSGPGHAIARLTTGVAAFVGRALKGPVDLPLVVHSFAEYVRLFGGLWQPSTMSYALEQYFENDGRTAIVVRVANGARPPTITLPTAGAPLTLIGLAPGSREYLRASVDLDGIGDNEDDRFNLVVQRTRTPDSERIEEQEIFRRLSVLPGSDRPVATVLLDSRLVRVRGEVPRERPLRTPSRHAGLPVGYAASNPDGDDGAPLTDYDIIGSSQRGTGLFALRSAPRFDLLCVPPLTRGDDVGLATLTVAARVCRDHHAMLVVDPPAAWATAAQAVEALKPWPFRSEQAVMYFPRLLALDRVRGRYEVFASCGAAAGLIARGDSASPVWGASEIDEPVLRPTLRNAVAIEDGERARLAQLGVNTFSTVRPLARRAASPRTLGAGGSGPADWTWLAARRHALFVIASVEEGTRWIVFQHDRPDAWARLRAQVEAFLAALEDDGAFVGRTSAERWFVICDERVNPPETVAAGKVNLLLGFALARAGEFHAFLVTHQSGASRVRAVSVNRLATSGERVEEEIETAILQGIALEP